MKLSKKVIIIIAAVLVFLIGGGIAIATNTPTARAERQLNLGNKYLQEGKYQEAILAFQKVIEIEPKNIPARLGLGKAYVATKEYANAETVLKEVINIEQNNLQARKDLFEVYLKEGKIDEAKAILQEIIELDPNIDSKQYYDKLEEAKAFSASKASYDQGIKQMNDKQYLAAVESFQKVVKEDSERYDDAQSKISECKKAFIQETLQKAKDAGANQDYKTALDLIEQVLNIDPNNEEALKLKGEYSSIIQQEEQKNQVNNNSDINLEKAPIINNTLSYINNEGKTIILPNLPQHSQQYYTIYSEGFRDGRTEVALFDAVGDFHIDWRNDGSLYLSDEKETLNYIHYYLDGDKWKRDYYDGENHISDWALNVYITSVDIYKNNSIIMKGK